MAPTLSPSQVAQSQSSPRKGAKALEERLIVLKNENCEYPLRKDPQKRFVTGGPKPTRQKCDHKREALKVHLYGKGCFVAVLCDTIPTVRFSAENDFCKMN
eukprot:2623792-Rhodomonas_salina.2